MKKINIGIILMVITIIAFIVFVIIEDKIEKEDMQRGLEFIQEYYDNIRSKYMMLPEKYRDIENKMPEEEYNNFLKEFKQELSKYVLDEQLETIYNRYKVLLDYQYEGKVVYKKWEASNIQYRTIDLQVTNLSKVEDDLLYAEVSYNLKYICDKRESAIFDKSSGRYIGTITKDYSEIVNSAAILVMKKMKDGDFKIVYTITNFF